ncbi:TIGR03086 family protein [Pseudonocardia sp. CNS-004]|nr:TIGR03086 family protein [Pseudonocardia sp. CNS-004]
MTPAEEHRYVAGRFLDVARRATAQQWDAPAPVSGWTARDVVGHLVEWFPAFLASGAGVVLPEVPSVEEDPVAAWTARAGDVQHLIEDPGERVLENPHIGTIPLAEAIDRFYSADIFMHTWDLARALGQEPALDPARCDALVAGAQEHEEAMRASGQYGPRVDVPADAPAQDRMVGFIGRDPYWRPSRER